MDGRTVRFKPEKKRPANRKGKRVYSDEVIASLRLIRAFFWYKCGKILAPFMRQQMPYISGWPAFNITPDIAEKLKTISPATIDRYLKRDKEALRLKGKSLTKPLGSLKSRIPMRTFYSVPGIEPVKHPAVYIVFGNTVFQEEKVFQPCFLCFPVQFDVFPAFGEGHHRQKGNDNNFDKGIAFLAVDSRVFDIVKKVDDGWYGFWDHNCLHSRIYWLFLPLLYSFFNALALVETVPRIDMGRLLQYFLYPCTYLPMNSMPV
jgi:hypothetical protein